MEMCRRAQGCWTCKQRKIGCDRGSPACNNCLRTGRNCLGYDIRLAWPDQPDGRRRKDRLPDQETYLPANNSEYYGKQFLNVTYEDLVRARSGQSLDSLALILRPPRPKPALPLLPNIHDRESYLIKYYATRLSRMISTIDINNGFRDDIIPMALMPYNSASEGLRNAMLALAAFHLYGPEEALPYKAKALRSLSSSLSIDSMDITETQLATSMMLCVYNVFDETEGNWSLHLNGAKNLLRKLTNIRGGYMRYHFLFTWFLYHEVLGEFINPSLYSPKGPVSIQLRGNIPIEQSTIVGSLGCSVEVMEIISYVNGLRALELRGDALNFSPTERSRRNEKWQSMEARLRTLEQRLEPLSATQLPQHEQAMVRATAELYRIAAYLYLQRTSNSTQANEIRAVNLQEAFRMLRSLSVCTSPWPLFIIACESETDEQRIEILEALDKMVDVRHIGNIYVLRDIIESIWNQQDLQADNGRSTNVKWWNVIDMDITVPWFI
ncbi:fungal-specific transcription factor domain-containing protein [Xylariales sp. PMI_506]|nr:fungal-specific transcription factor domain-containing protein [Xylariales sp. PMI_506]